MSCIIPCLQTGDALFMPEGYWHSVESTQVTTAVNFWWRSAFDASLGSAMDAYQLRRLAQSLTEARKAEVLAQAAGAGDCSRHDQNDIRAEAPGHRAHAESTAGMSCSSAAEDGQQREGQREEHASQADPACSNARGENREAEAAEATGRERKRHRPEQGAAVGEQKVIERLAVAVSSALAGSGEGDVCAGSSSGM